MLPRLVVVIDEFAALVSEQPDFLHALVGIAQRGRSLGVHLILATQRPSGVISDDIRANTNLRLALRLHDTADAIDVVGDGAPAAIPRGLAGRAVMRLGPDEVLTFQTARCTTPLPGGGTELDVLVARGSRCVGACRCSTGGVTVVGSACRRGCRSTQSSVATGIVGLVDDPDGQRVLPLRWDRADGQSAARRCGRQRSHLDAGVARHGRDRDGSGAHLYVIDGRGDQALATFEHSPSVWRRGEPA